MALPAALAGLATAAAYAHAVAKIEIVETHMSWVVLTGDYAYKIKRPVHYPFVDMRTLERRAFLCHEEVRLNRRFAPELYLGVCAITAGDDGAARIGGLGRVLEHAVRMRQFSREQELDRLLDARQIAPAELERFGSLLAQVHAQCPTVGPQQSWGQPDRIATQLLKNFAECLHALTMDGSPDQCAALRQPFEQRLAALSCWLAERRAAGRVRECHGDLHARNVVRLARGLTGFDCLEFEPEFRWIDVAEEIALLLMDMESRACLDHAHAFLSGYLAESGDYHAVTGLTLYKAHHGFVRAKVAAISAAQSAELARRAEWRRDCHRLLATAARALGQQQPLLLLTCGVSGSGKTWLARQLAARLRCLHLRSDVERKRLAGLKPSAKSHSALRAGLYGEEMTGAVYSRLADFAAAILSGGYSVIVDATFARRAERARFSQLAASLHVPLQLIECRAPEATLRARIAERRAMAGDASEADERVLDWQLQHFQPVSADENLPTTVVNTEAAGVVDALAANVRCLYEQH